MGFGLEHQARPFVHENRRDAGGGGASQGGARGCRFAFAHAGRRPLGAGAERAACSVDAARRWQFQADGGYIPKREDAGAWFWRQSIWRHTAADAFLADAERLRRESPRQDLPPAQTAEELAERLGRALGKSPTEADLGRCAGEVLRHGPGRDAR